MRFKISESNESLSSACSAYVLTKLLNQNTFYIARENQM